MASLRQNVSGLRTRFAPKSRVGQGLVSFAPWIDGIVLLLLFILLEGKFVLTPGIVVNLPEAPIRGGLSEGLAAVVLSVESTKAGAREEIVVFDDEPFNLANEDEMKALASMMKVKVKSRELPALMIFSDTDIAHGSIARLCDIARSAGIQRVNLATRSPEETMVGW